QSRVRCAVMLGGRWARSAPSGAFTPALALTAASATLAAPGIADSGGTRPTDATTQDLHPQRHPALLSLYAPDSRLEGWRARLASLEGAAAAMRERRASLRAEL